MAQQDTDQIFREVDEELRRERLEQLWKEYGTYIAAGAIAIVVGVGGWKLYEYQQAKRAADNGARLIAALQLAEDKKPAEADKALQALAAGGSGGYPALARLKLAGAEAAAGKAEAAFKQYEAIAADRSVDEVLRGLAGLKAALLRLDSADFTEMQNRLTPLKDAKSPWRYSAREILGLSAWKAGKTAEAEKEFQALTEDAGVPPSLRQRADMMLALLVEAGKAPAAAKIEAVPPAAGDGAGKAKAGDPPATKPAKK